jgi:hypothetical protein
MRDHKFVAQVEEDVDALGRGFKRQHLEENPEKCQNQPSKLE